MVSFGPASSWAKIVVDKNKIKRVKMEDGEWRMEDGEWRKENGEWKIEIRIVLRRRSGDSG
jgi:hypothetical protein